MHPVLAGRNNRMGQTTGHPARTATAEEARAQNGFLSVRAVNLNATLKLTRGDPLLVGLLYLPHSGPPDPSGVLDQESWRFQQQY